MKEEKPLVDKTYLLEKFSGKGGWTYALIPEIEPNKQKPFGWEVVKGSIDGYELKKFKLMPMGNGRLFLPVKSEIRKKIKKQAGDKVHIILYLDQGPQEIPEEILFCFENEPRRTYENFLKLSQEEQKAYLDRIYEAKTEEAKSERILKMMDRLQKN